MNRTKRFLALICTGVMVLAALAQGKVDTRVHIFDNNVRSLKVSLASNMYIPPVLMMNG
jgi:hypothetical protein